MVELNGEPEGGWCVAFNNPTEWTSMCSSRGVRFVGSALYFNADERHVPDWARLIDIWIAHANKVRGEQIAKAERDEQARQRARQESAERVKLADKYRSL